MSSPGGAEDTGGDWVDVAHVDVRAEAPFTSSQRRRVATYIRDAESILRENIPGIDDRITEVVPAPVGMLSIVTVQRVVSQAVLRAMDPGRGRLGQYAAGEGAFNRSQTYVTSSGGPERTGGVQFTEQELDDCREPQTVPSGFGVVEQSIPQWRVP